MINECLKINQLVLKNRIVMPPMATSKADENGLVTEDLLNFYRLRANGGYLGLVITEHSYILEEGKAHGGQTSMSKDEDVEGLSRLVNVFHEQGIPVFAQLSHAGIKACSEQPFGPCAAEGRFKMAEAMDEAHIGLIVDSFVKAALRAKKAGYDGVEIHSAHGYLLNQFYSPITNKRTDEYGTTRYKLHLEVIKAVRKAVGEDYPIALRLGAVDYGMEGGSTLQDALEVAVACEAAGVDMLDISGGLSGYIIPGVTEPGYFEDVTAAIKQRVSIPVLSTGGYNSKESVESALVNCKADLVGIGRVLLKDPQFAKNIVE